MVQSVTDEQFSVQLHHLRGLNRKRFRLLRQKAGITQLQEKPEDAISGEQETITPRSRSEERLEAKVNMVK